MTSGRRVATYCLRSNQSLTSIFKQRLCSYSGVSATSGSIHDLETNVSHFHCTKIPSRELLLISGPDVYTFMQGLVTNNIFKLRTYENETCFPLPTPNSPVVSFQPLYAAMLNAQGRFMYDMFMYKPAKAGDFMNNVGSGPQSSAGGTDECIFAEVDKSKSEELLKALKKYRLRAKVNFEPCGSDMSAWAAFPGNFQQPSLPNDQGKGNGSIADPMGQWSSGASSEGGWRWHCDPRLPLLGYRGIFPEGSPPPLVAADQMVEERLYRRWRYSLGVAEGCREIPTGEALPLEYNLDYLCAIDFNKGCYIGQELTARTHHRGVVRKRVMPVKLTVRGTGNESPFSAVDCGIVDSKTGKKVGKMVAADAELGVAHLRLESALQSGVCLATEEGGWTVEPCQPQWWEMSGEALKTEGS